MQQQLIERFEPQARKWRENIEKPLSEARGLTNDAYTDPDYYRLECDTLLARNWLAVAQGIDIPNPGDALPVTILGRPIILVRNPDRSIRAFHNACVHRGATLLEEPAAGLKHLQCPYHAWTYDLSGNLIATPFIGGAGQNKLASFDPSCHGLKQVSVAVWFDVIFVVLDNTAPAPDFADYIAPLADRWRDFDPSAFTFGGRFGELHFDIACNWKLAVENYCDAYHLPWVHPSLNRYSRLQDHYGIAAASYAGQGSRVYAPTMDSDGLQVPSVPDVPVAGPNGAEYIALFPNVLLGVQRDHYYSIILSPAGHDRTTEKIAIYYGGDAPNNDRYHPLLEQHHRNWEMVFGEDVSILERLQRGRMAMGFDGGVFSEAMEEPTQAFYRWTTQQLCGNLAALKQ